LNGAPWVLEVAVEAEPTFLAHLLTLTALHGHAPWPDHGYPLPDDPPPEQRSFFPSVASDGARSHHFGIRPAPDTVTAVVDRITALVTGPPDGTSPTPSAPRCGSRPCHPNGSAPSGAGSWSTAPGGRR
jgi:hypothetical protein